MSKPAVLQKYRPSEKDDKKQKEDPNGSLMEMMKEMYLNGDEEMKKTIAESWSKSRDRKAGKHVDDSDEDEEKKKKDDAEKAAPKQNDDDEDLEEVE